MPDAARLPLLHVDLTSKAKMLRRLWPCAICSVSGKCCQGRDVKVNRPCSQGGCTG